MSLQNTPSKRKSIEAQRKILELESTELKKKRSHYEEFDEDDSRQRHDEATLDAVIEHYETVATTSKKKKKKIEVIYIKAHIRKYALNFLCYFCRKLLL